MGVGLTEWMKSGKRGFEVDIRGRLPDGTPHRERVKAPVSTRSAALRWAQQREAAIIAQGGRAPAEEDRRGPRQAPALSVFQKRFLTYSETNNKPSTVCAKGIALRMHLVPFFGATRLDQIGPALVEEYKAQELREGQAPKSVNNHLAILRKLLTLAVEWGELQHAPRVRQLRVAPGTYQFLTFEQTERFLRAAAPEWRAFLVMALKTGLRVGELLALRWDDVDLVSGRLVVRRTAWRDQEGSPKGGRAREVPLSDEAVATLKAHRHLKGPYVFCEPDGKRLTHSRVKDVVPRTCARAGLPKRLTTHDLRHTFASHLVMRGVALKAIQELLGHATIDMTIRYAHLSPDVRRDAVRLLDAAAPARGELGEKQSA
jgi:integrase